jgi:hypothetical protein
MGRLKIQLGKQKQEFHIEFNREKSLNVITWDGLMMINCDDKVWTTIALCCVRW